MQSKQNNQLHGNQKNVHRKKNDIKEQTNKKKSTPERII